MTRSSYCSASDAVCGGALIVSAPRLFEILTHLLTRCTQARIVSAKVSRLGGWIYRRPFDVDRYSSRSRSCKQAIRERHLEYTDHDVDVHFVEMNVGKTWLLDFEIGLNEMTYGPIRV